MTDRLTAAEYRSDPQQERPMLKPYFFFIRDPHLSGSMLVFEENSRKARKLGFRSWYFTNYPEDFVGARVRRADDAFMAFAQGDEPHVVDSYDADVETWDEALALLTGRPLEEVRVDD